MFQYIVHANLWNVLEHVSKLYFNHCARTQIYLLYVTNLIIVIIMYIINKNVILFKKCKLYVLNIEVENEKTKYNLKTKLEN